MAYNIEWARVDGIYVFRSKTEFATIKDGKKAIVGLKIAIGKKYTGYKVVKVGYVKPAPKPEYFVHDNRYGWLCRDSEISVYCNSAAEAVEAWTSAYKRNRDMV